MLIILEQPRVAMYGPPTLLIPLTILLGLMEVGVLQHLQDLMLTVLELMNQIRDPPMRC